MSDTTRPISRAGWALRLPVTTRRTGLAKAHAGGAHLPAAVPVAARARALDQVVAQALRPVTMPVLRVMLGLVFVWFGGLKVIGHSPVAELVAKTLPFGNRGLVLVVLGIAEVALGLLLMSGVLVRLALPALAMHLAGTFSAFVMVPGLMFRGGNPLLLTADGEFVLKNVVLIAATLVLIAHTSLTATNRHPAS